MERLHEFGCEILPPKTHFPNVFGRKAASKTRIEPKIYIYTLETYINRELCLKRFTGTNEVVTDETRVCPINPTMKLSSQDDDSIDAALSECIAMQGDSVLDDAAEGYRMIPNREISPTNVGQDALHEFIICQNFGVLLENLLERKIQMYLKDKSENVEAPPPRPPPPVMPLSASTPKPSEKDQENILWLGNGSLVYAGHCRGVLGHLFSVYTFLPAPGPN